MTYYVVFAPRGKYFDRGPIFATPDRSHAEWGVEEEVRRSRYDRSQIVIVSTDESEFLREVLIDRPRAAWTRFIVRPPKREAWLCGAN